MIDTPYLEGIRSTDHQGYFFNWMPEISALMIQATMAGQTQNLSSFNFFKKILADKILVPVQHVAKNQVGKIIWQKTFWLGSWCRVYVDGLNTAIHCHAAPAAPAVKTWSVFKLVLKSWDLDTYVYSRSEF